MCDFWDVFFARGWVAFYQVVAGLLSVLAEAAVHKLPGGKLKVQHLVGKLSWAMDAIPGVPALLRRGELIGVRTCTVNQFLREAQARAR